MLFYMKHFKLIFSVGIVLSFSTIITSCSTEDEKKPVAKNEVEVMFDVSQVLIQQAINPENEDFLKVYHAAIASRNESNRNFVDVFFKKSNSLFPNRNYIEYFKVNIELANDDSNKGVKKYFLAKRKEHVQPFLTALSSRLQQFGVVYADLIDGKDKVKLGIIEDVDQQYIARLIMSNAKVEFFEVYKTDELVGLLNELKQLGQPEHGLATGTDSTYSGHEDYGPLVSLSDNSYPEASVFGYIRNDGSQFRVDAQYKNAVDVFLNTKEVKYFLPKNLRFKWSKDQVKDENGNLDGYILHPCKLPRNGRARVDQDDIKEATPGSDSETGEYTVNIKMTPDGEKEWAAMTSDNVGRTIAICMNEIVISAPSVRGAIKGGDTEISGSFTMAEAQDFSRILSIGNLPLPCAFVSIKKL